MSARSRWDSRSAEVQDIPGISSSAGTGGSSGSSPPVSKATVCRNERTPTTEMPRTSSASGHVDLGHEDPVEASLERGERRREDAAYGPQPAVERQLAEEHRTGETLRRHERLGGEHREGDRQVIVRAGLGQRRRREVDRHALVGPGRAGVGHRRAAPVARLVDHRVGESDEDRRRQPARDVDLDLDRPPRQSVERDRVRRGGHQATPAMRSTTGAPRGGTTTETMSMRTLGGCTSCTSSQCIASRRSLVALCPVIASNGPP